MSDLTPPPPPPPAAASPVIVGASAGFGQRFLAAVIDGILLGVPFFIVNTVVRNNVSTEIKQCVGDEFSLCEVPTGSGWAIILLFWAVSVAVYVWYFGTFEGNKTQTIGKKAMSIRVVDAVTGQPIGVGRGIGRYFARILSAIPCLLGYFWMLWDADHQTWHDKITTARVVRA